MQVCSLCLRCYDDSVISCLDGDHPALSRIRGGSCDSITGYHLESLLETGRNGETYRARHVASGQPCQIKILTADEKKGLQFLQEAKLAATLFHPSVADVYEAGSLESGELFVAAEMPDGQTLRQMLDTVGVPQLLTSILIVRQAAEALHSIHQNGLTHRAVRPENIIITTDAENRLLVRIQNLDFGGLREHAIISNKFLVDSALDSLRYFAPEQCSGGVSAVQADVYSLGIVFYETLAGVPPFDAPSAAELIEKQKHQHPPEFKIDNFNLRMLVTHALMESLQKQPQMRTSSANALARQLRHIEQLATHTSTPPPAGVTPTMPQRSAGVIAAAANPAVPVVPFPVQPAAAAAPKEFLREVSAPAVQTDVENKTVAPLIPESEPEISKPETEPAVTEVETEPVLTKLDSEPVLTELESEPNIAERFESESVAGIEVEDEQPTAAQVESGPIVDETEIEPAIIFEAESAGDINIEVKGEIEAEAEPAIVFDEVEPVSVEVENEPLKKANTAGGSSLSINFAISVPDFAETREAEELQCEEMIAEDLVEDLVKEEAAPAPRRSRLKLCKKRLHSKIAPLVPEIPEQVSLPLVETSEVDPVPTFEPVELKPVPPIEPVEVDLPFSIESEEVEHCPAVKLSEVAPVQVQAELTEITLVQEDPKIAAAAPIERQHIVVDWDQPEDDIPSLEDVIEVRLRDEITEPLEVQPAAQYTKQNVLDEDDLPHVEAQPHEVHPQFKAPSPAEHPASSPTEEVQTVPTIVRKTIRKSQRPMIRRVEKRQIVELYPENTILSSYADQSAGFSIDHRAVIIGGGLIAVIVSLLLGTQVLQLDPLFNKSSETAAAKSIPRKQSPSGAPAKSTVPAKPKGMQTFDKPLPVEDDAEEIYIRPVPIKERVQASRDVLRTSDEKATAPEKTPNSGSGKRNAEKNQPIRSTIVISSDNGKIKSKVEPEKKAAGNRQPSTSGSSASSTRPRIVANPRP